MKRRQLKLGSLVFGLGLLGVLSMLNMELPLTPEMKAIALEKVSEESLRWLILINPTLMLLVFTILGTAFFRSVNLSAPILESISGAPQPYDLPDILRTGAVYGIAAGILLVFISMLFYPTLPQEFIDFGENFKPPVLTRFLYGGITEEILMRFGLMTVIVLVASKISGKLNSTAYWIGISIAALLFAAGHLPIVFQAVSIPTGSLYAYIILGNTVGGLIFGWLYWKKGLEAAFVGHIFAHIIMLAGEQMIQFS